MATNAARREAVEIAARIVTHQTFGPFEDDPESPFFQADGLSPEQTWERLAENVALVCANAILQGIEDVPLRRSLIYTWHREIFGELFPDAGGQMRVGMDKGQYGLVVGTEDAPQERTHHAVSGKELPDRLDKIFAGFERFAGEEREFALEELAEETARLYAKFLNLHPFEDGNGRVGFVLLQFSLARLDLPAVDTADHDPHQWALGLALRRDGKQTYAQLTQFLVDRFDEASRIWNAAQELVERDRT